MIGEIQLNILTGMMLMSDIYESGGKKYLTNDINPFYKQPLENVEKNIDYAKEIYPKVFIRFQNTHFVRTGKLFPMNYGVLNG